MPNWCDCKLTISGCGEELARFRDGVKVNADSSYLEILPSYYPIPEAFKDIRSGFHPLHDGRTLRSWCEAPKSDGDGMPMCLEISEEEQRAIMTRFGATNSYDWCMTFWGSKSGDRYTELCTEPNDSHPDKLVYTFLGAWNCPCTGFLTVSGNFPLLTFRLVYREEMVGFRGLYVCRNGMVLKDCFVDIFECIEIN